MSTIRPDQFPNYQSVILLLHLSLDIKKKSPNSSPLPLVSNLKTNPFKSLKISTNTPNPTNNNQELPS